MQKLIVEITGPAGVGKSFLSKSLCSNLEVVDHKNKTITFKTILKSFSIIPFIFLLSKDRFNIYTRFLINLAKWEAIERPNSGIFLIDQGPWHFLCGSIIPRAFKGARRIIIKYWNGYLNLPDIIIYLTADPALIRDRRKFRSRKKEKTIILEEIENSINEFESTLQAAKDIHAGGKFITYKIKDSDSLVDITNSISKLIKSQT